MGLELALFRENFCQGELRLHHADFHLHWVKCRGHPHRPLHCGNDHVLLSSSSFFFYNNNNNSTLELRVGVRRGRSCLHRAYHLIGRQGMKMLSSRTGLFALCKIHMLSWALVKSHSLLRNTDRNNATFWRCDYVSILVISEITLLYIISLFQELFSVDWVPKLLDWLWKPNLDLKPTLGRPSRS